MAVATILKLMYWFCFRMARSIAMLLNFSNPNFKTFGTCMCSDLECSVLEALVHSKNV